MDATEMDLGMLGVIVDDSTLGLSVETSSSGSVDRGPTLEDRGRLVQLRVGVEVGMASGIEPTRLIGEDKYPGDERLRSVVDAVRRSSDDRVYGDDNQSVEPSGE